jgi:hypothetical protein
MKIIEGAFDTLPPTVHVEQDGNHFFILANRREDGAAYAPSLAVVISDTPVNEEKLGMDGSGEAAQAEIRAALIGMGITPTFDY